jgi:hypothetical protein
MRREDFNFTERDAQNHIIPLSAIVYAANRWYSFSEPERLNKAEKRIARGEWPSDE